MVRDKSRHRTPILEWTPEQTFQLISLVEERTFLWDTQSLQYRDRTVRDRAWDEIATELNYPKNEVNCKWSLLRQQFRNAIGKSRTTNEYYSAMQFLAPVFLNNTDTTELCPDPLSISKRRKYISAEEKCENNESKVFEKDLETSTASSDAVQPLVTTRRRKPEKQAVKEFKKIPTISPIQEPLVISVKDREEDEFDLWGRYLASTLRNYPDKVAVRKFKAAVSLSLAKLESGELDKVQND